MKRLFLTLCAVSVALAAGAACAAEVTATLEPAQVAVGETAELTVTVNGSSTAAPNVPDVPGLDIEHVGQSTQVQIINGAMSASSVHTYQVMPQRAGTFTIPAIQAGAARSRPLTLRASGGSANPNTSARSQQPSRGSARGSPLPPPNVPMPQASADAPTDARYGFIHLVVPKKEFYVGELVPVEVNAFVPAGMQATVNGLPTLSSEAFTLNPLGNKPDQDEREINGHDYTVLTWHSALTAVKTGDFSLTMQMPATVVVRDQPQRRSRGNSNDPFDQMFNDPFFDDAFAGVMGHQKEVTLGSEPDVLSILSLPAANRPADFAGAVGNFQVRATASPTSATAGDPLTLRLEVSGTGDFDRLTSDVLPSADGWKTYPAKSTFVPEDSAGYRGTKTFEQVVMAKDASVKELPALRLSFFNPETKRYETRTTAPIPVQITGAPANLAAATPVATIAPNIPPTPAAPELVPNKVEPGHLVATLRPVFTDPWFVAAQGLPLCALAVGLTFIRRQRRFAADPRLARADAAERAVHMQIDAMDRAMRQHDSTAFFLAARGALQQRLGERWGTRPETITLAEIQTRLNGAGDAIRPIFETADRIIYSGQDFGDADYRQWQDLILTQLKILEKHS